MEIRIFSLYAPSRESSFEIGACPLISPAENLGDQVMDHLADILGRARQEEGEGFAFYDAYGEGVRLEWWTTCEPPLHLANIVPVYPTVTKIAVLQRIFRCDH